MRTLVHLIRCVVGLDGPYSQVSEQELQMLLKYSRNASVICEIGPYEGKTSVAFAKNTTGKVYSVDPCFKGRLGIPYGYWIARLHSTRSDTRNLVFLQGFSKEVAATFKLPIDFLFIDGDHSYEAVKIDWANWYPKIVEGGIIALHDSRPAANSPTALGTMQFYVEDIPACSGVIELDSVDSLSVLQVTRIIPNPIDGPKEHTATSNPLPG